MTIIRRDFGGSPFGAWLRDQTKLDSTEFCISITDIDHIIHRFSKRNEAQRTMVAHIVEHIQIVELKVFGADIPFAQRDTLQVLNDMLLKACGGTQGRRRPVRVPERRFGATAGHRYARWLGVHLLQLSSDRPDRSDRIVWDGKDINEATLIELLQFDRDPMQPSRFLDTRRHHRRPFRETHPDLFSAA
jgi:hypothetical protein